MGSKVIVVVVIPNAIHLHHITITASGEKLRACWYFRGPLRS